MTYSMRRYIMVYMFIPVYRHGTKWHSSMWGSENMHVNYICFHDLYFPTVVVSDTQMSDTSGSYNWTTCWRSSPLKPACCRKRFLFCFGIPGSLCSMRLTPSVPLLLRLHIPKLTSSPWTPCWSHCCLPQPPRASKPSCNPAQLAPTVQMVTKTNVYMLS